VSRRSFDWFLLNLVDVDLHSVIFSITSPIIMIGISNATVPSLKSSTASVDGNLSPSSVPNLEPSFDSSYIPSLIPSYIPSREPISETSTVSLTDTVNDDGPTKAIISSHCHNLRLPLPVGTEIFILFFAVPNSEPSAVPSSIPRAIPNIEHSLATSADPISAPNESIIFLITCITFARNFTSLSSAKPRLISSTTSVRRLLYQVLFPV
jgi:hypothetical protein